MLQEMGRELDGNNVMFTAVAGTAPYIATCQLMFAGYDEAGAVAPLGGGRGGHRGRPGVKRRRRRRRGR